MRGLVPPGRMPGSTAGETPATTQLNTYAAAHSGAAAPPPPNQHTLPSHLPSRRPLTPAQALKGAAEKILRITFDFRRGRIPTSARQGNVVVSQRDGPDSPQ